jgi:hypothetical protein
MAAQMFIFKILQGKIRNPTYLQLTYNLNNNNNNKKDAERKSTCRRRTN